MQAFRVALRPSPYLCVASFIWHGTALWLAWSAFEDGLRWLLCMGILLSAVWAWHYQYRRHNNTVLGIEIDAHGRAVLLMGDGIAYAAVLRSGSVVLRHAMVLHWDKGERIVCHWVSADMTDSHAFRRLKVWARWAQEP